jgi:hypothetical protein
VAIKAWHDAASRGKASTIQNNSGDPALAMEIGAQAEKIRALNPTATTNRR